MSRRTMPHDRFGWACRCSNWGKPQPSRLSAERHAPRISAWCDGCGFAPFLVRYVPTVVAPPPAWKRVKCPTCRAAPGCRCFGRTFGGVWSHRPHVAREAEAERALLAAARRRSRVTP